MAKWTEDKVWYRARVEKVEGKLAEVTSLDYGNKELVSKCHVVKTVLNIPVGEDIDEVVKHGIDAIGLDIGDVIIAKWAED